MNTELTLTSDMLVHVAILTARVDMLDEHTWRPKLHPAICRGPGQNSVELDDGVSVCWLVSAGRVLMTLSFGKAWLSVVSAQEFGTRLGIQGCLCTLEEANLMLDVCRAQVDKIVCEAGKRNPDVGLGVAG